jgi:hypothetical protein
MKRILHVVLVTLMIVSTIGTADAKQTKKRASKAKAPQETVLTAKPGPAKPGPGVKRTKKQVGVETNDDGENVVSRPGPNPFGPPVELSLKRAGSKKIDLRLLPQTGPAKAERPEREEPTSRPVTIEGGITPEVAVPSVPPRNAPAPPTIMNFDGLDFANWGNGHPPDTVGDVGKDYYIQSLNTSLGIYRKSDGVRVAAFSYNTFMSQGNFGNLCDTNNFGDPVILYDTFEDRWIITDFAFSLDGSNNVINPPGSFQCFAASMTGDPVSGGWNFYSINTAGGLGDYPKFGIWPDGLYMSANMFGYPAGGSFQSPRVYALNKAQMYAGKPSVQVVTFNAPAADFTILPSNARLQTGTPPAGTPNYFLSTWEFTNALTIYKMHVDWNHISTSTFTGPDVPIAATSWPNAAVANAPSQGGNLLDVLQIRAMMQNQYTNLGGVESLWAAHTVRRGTTTGFAAPRWYQVDVTGGNVNLTVPQAATWDPDGANVMHRFIPSLAVDRAGNMALGYSTSSSTTKPAIKYAGRLASDPVNTLGQTEQVLIQGTGTQLGNCGSSSCIRWGDYAAMSLDPDGCTFWMTSEYYNVDGLNHLTRIGSFALPGCTTVGAGGTLQGTVTFTVGGGPVSGANVQFGARSTTTNASGVYSFTSIPAGTYPSVTVTYPGYNSATAANIVITDGGTTVQDFSLTAQPVSSCAVDTTQADFQTGIPNGVDLTTSPGDVVLFKPNVDQQNGNLSTSGVGITVTTWGGQTFTPAVTGQLTKADINLFCSGCTGTTPNLTLSVRATAAGLPTGADLATATVTGFNSGASGYYTGTFGAPPTLTAGTMYALCIRPTANPSIGTYALTRSSTDVYAGGTRVAGATSGTVWSIPLTAGSSTDSGFVTHMDSGFAPSGNLVSGTKDSNPAAGLTPVWSTISWTANLPASTTVQFQVAGSNSDSGPFNFVGPDGTAGTFFTTTGASLAQFFGLRYLQYKAYLATGNGAVTPTLSDVSLCFVNTDCSAAITVTPTVATACANSTGNTASGPAGETSYSWSITNGSITGGGTTQTVTYTAGASGTVVLLLNVVEPSGCHKSGSANVTIPSSSVPTPTITPGGSTTFCTGGSVMLSSSSATGNQWYLNGNPIGGATNSTYLAAAAGDYTVVVTDPCANSSSPSAIVTVTINASPTTPTITPGGPTTFCTGGSVTLTSSSVGGNQWYLNGNPIGGETNQTYVATASGSYTVVVTASGCTSTGSAAMIVTVNPLPATPTITPGGPTTFCTGGSVTLTSSSASGNQWYLNGNLIGGATNQTYAATASGNYTVIVTASGCSSSASAATTVTVNPIPPTPVIGTGGPTTFCAGGSVTLTSSSASGNQWSLNGNPIGGETNQTYVATASGNYTVIVTTSGCSSSASAATTVTVNPIPATPTITGGPTTFCAGGSVTLTSSSASGNQWYVNGNPIGGATNQTYVASVAGDYTVVATASGCSSAASAVTTVTINPNPDATITAAGSVVSGSTGNAASVANAGVGATYAWSATGGTITAGNGTPNVTYTGGAVGTLTLNVTVTVGGCSDTRSANVNVTAAAAVTVTLVTPAAGTIAGNSAVTITGTGFAAGATVTFGGSAATSVVVVNSTTITARTPAHAAGAVSVTVTNTDTSNGTLAAGFTYLLRQFDANGDTVIDPADIFYLVNYLFLSGPAPRGAAGMPSGDANNDGVVDPADIFYIINYLFTGGPAPSSTPGAVTTNAAGAPASARIAGSVTLGTAVERNGHYVIPVIVTANPETAVPQALSLKVSFKGATADNAVIRRAGAAAALQPSFEISRRTDDGLAYLLTFNQQAALSLGSSRSAVVAEIEISAREAAGMTIEVDPSLTMLGDAGGVRKATVGNGSLRVSGTSIGEGRSSPDPKAPKLELN